MVDRPLQLYYILNLTGLHVKVATQLIEQQLRLANVLNFDGIIKSK
jgi:hypothetical protein